ncbi:hypothetical protein TRFO_30010 [Tritrichomonas foetus]|uniref:ATPase domain-containing protein n=1 Tax=Tritrichomonas foetus TaxID=1144522 RepID=A0A1J4JUE3_9EUKA|nr:hypothetical protein TRFO_30010 [Tritrichomonas foetus]|eukprot:OHT02761.1 hypothetical protein TRFO_30010 [Tritrichomonas foetus]
MKNKKMGDYPNSLSNKRRNIFLLIGTALLVIILAYIYFLTKVFVRRTDPLPYIWPTDLNTTLHSYLRTFPSRHVHILSGPYKTGKSAALLNITNELRQNGNLVFNFNYRKVRSENDALGFTKLGVLEALTFFNDSRIIQNIKQIDFNDTFSINQFFDSLEQITATTIPVVIVQSVNRLRDFAPQVYAAAFARLSRRDQYRDNVPVIIETSDTLFRMNYLPPFYQVSEVDEIEDPYTNLGSKLHAFTNAELKKIKHAVGFQGGAVDNIFEEIRKHEPIDVAIEKEVRKINEKVNALKTESKVLHRICDSKERPIYVGKGEIPEIESLLKKGLLYINDEYKLRVANHAVWKCLCT